MKSATFVNLENIPQIDLKKVAELTVPGRL